VVSGREIVARLAAELPIEPVAPAYRGEVARRWRYTDGSGEIGVIASVTQPFCGDCTRARLSADGKLFTCLFAAAGADLRGPLRSGADDAALGELVRSLWAQRDDRYSELRSAATARLPRAEMSYLGG
jgi:cyclic pyranopterin phosphate synthase